MSEETQPTMPLPSEQVPGRGSFVGLSRWWHRGLWQKVAVLVSIPLLVSCVCCNSSLIFAVTPAGQQFAREANATATAQTRAAIQVTAHAGARTRPPPVTSLRPTPSPTYQPTATLQPTATAPLTSVAICNGTPGGYPHVGGPLTDFVHAYMLSPGQTIDGTDGAIYRFDVNAAQTIELLVQVCNNGTVTDVTVEGLLSWDNQQVFDSCAQFLPNGATEFSSVPPWTDYHSSAGDIQIQISSPGSCEVYLMY